MANDTTGTPIRIDTFGADVSISAKRFLMRRMIVTAYSSAKTVTFLDADDAVMLVLECPAGETIMIDDEKGILFDNGLKFDDSASDLAANDFIFIWKQR